MGYSGTFPILRNEASNEAFGHLINHGLFVLLLHMMSIYPHITLLSVESFKESFQKYYRCPKLDGCAKPTLEI